MAGGPDSWPWLVVIWTQPKPTEQLVDRHELLTACLQQTIDMWHATKRLGDRTDGEAYLCGDRAYQHWIDWLAGVDNGNTTDPKTGMSGNGWYYDVLVHSREIAGRWLTQQASRVDSPARDHLLEAAQHFTLAAEVCMEDLESPWLLALPPGKFDQWSPQMRADQIKRLTAAREHDRKAVEATKQALATMGG